MTRALIYCRVSSAQQADDGTSLDTQEARCRAYCAEHGYQVIGVHSDTHTGIEYRQRPGLSALREQVRAGIAGVVVCYAVDRLSRNQAHLYIVAEEIEDAGGRLEFVTESFEDSAVGRFMRSVQSFFAEIEHEKIKERTTRGKLARAHAGRPMVGPKPRYGYAWADDGKTRLVVNEDEAAVVRRIYAAYADGATLRGVQADLLADGIPSPRGRQAWGIHSIRDILANPNYTGEAYTWFPRTDTRYVAVYDRDEAIRLPDDVYPRIVDPALWEAAQRRLRHNRERAARNNRKPESTLLRGGFIRCARCGRALAAVNRTGGRPPWYRCSASSYPDGDSRRCNVTIPAADVDAAVWGRIRAVLLDPGVIRAEADGRSHPVEPSRLASIERDLRDVVARQRRVASAIAILDDDEAAAPLTEQLTALARRKRELERDRANALAEAAAADADQLHMLSLAALRERVAGNIDQLDYDEKRELLDLFRVTVRVHPRGHEPRFEVDGLGPFA